MTDKPTCPSCYSTDVLPAGWINDGVTGPKCQACGHEWIEAMTDTKAMPVGVRVKALEWSEALPPDKDVSPYDHCWAQSPCGLYSIEWKRWKPGGGYSVNGPDALISIEESLDDAKAAAQADFASRILSTIEAGPGEGWIAAAMAHMSKIDSLNLTWGYLAALSLIGGEAAPVAERGEITDEMEILRRLAFDGDSIAFSKDGENAWFCGGDRAWVGEAAIIGLRARGFLCRTGSDEEDYSARDIISAKGRAFLAAPQGGVKNA